MSDPWEKIYPLVSTAAAYQAVGETATAAKILETLNAIPVADAEAWAYLWTDMASVYIDIGQTQAASDLLDKMLQVAVELENETRYFLLSAIANQAGNLDRQTGEQLLLAVLAALPKLQVRAYQSRLLNDVVAALESWSDSENHKAKVLTAAVQAAQASSIDEEIIPRPASEALVAIARFASSDAAVPILESLAEFIQQTSDDTTKMDVLNQIALSYGTIGRPQQGLDTLALSLETVRNQPLGYWHVRGLYAAAATADGLGADGLQTELLTQANQQIVRMAGSSPDSGGLSVSTFEAMADATVRFHDPQQTLDALMTTIDLTQQLSPFFQPYALRSLVRTALELENGQQAIMAVIEQAAKLDDSLEKAELLGDIAELTTQLNNNQIARMSLQRIVAVGGAMEEFQSLVFEKAFEIIGPWEDTQRAAVLSMLQGSIDVGDPLAQVELLSQLALEYAVIGDDDRSLAMLQRVLPVLPRLPERWTEYEIDIVASNVAQTAVRLKDQAQGEEIVVNAIAALNTLPNQTHRARALSTVADALLVWEAPTAHILDRLVANSEALTDPVAKARILQSTAAVYAQLSVKDSRQTALSLLEMVTPQLNDPSSDVTDLISDTALTYGQLGADTQAMMLLEQLYPDEFQSPDDFYQLFKIAETAIVLDALPVATDALGHMVQVASAWDREQTLELMEGFPPGALEFNYGNDPEQQLERLLNQTKANILVGTLEVIFELSSNESDIFSGEEFLDSALYRELDPVLANVMAAADSLTIPDEQFYVLRAVASAGLRIQNFAKASSAMALAIETISDTSDQLSFQAMDFLLEKLPQDDIATTATLLTLTVEQMQTVSENNKSIALSAISEHIVEIGQADKMLLSAVTYGE